MSDSSPEPTRSSRDRDQLHDRLQLWLAEILVDAEAVTIGELQTPGGSGMSNETLLFDASWIDEAGPRQASLVARVEPDPADIPLFPHYDLDLQFRVMELVAEVGAVPVPTPRWIEADPLHIGAPFFVMERINGRVPPDVPPYTFEGWLLEASAAQQRVLQDSSVALLADLHGIDLATHDADFLAPPHPGDTSLRRHFEGQRQLYEWARRDRRHPVVEATFGWLDANWPRETGDDVICWGDSRIGNIIYGGFEPVAVLDWEMATLGPRALDVGWMIFMHTFFDEIARAFDLPGLPDFLLAGDVADLYASRSGHRLENLDWYQTYAGLRHAIIMIRVTERQVHFGEAEWGQDVDAAIPHRHVLQEMIDGSWWDRQTSS